MIKKKKQADDAEREGRTSCLTKRYTQTQAKVTQPVLPLGAQTNWW